MIYSKSSGIADDAIENNAISDKTITTSSVETERTRNTKRMGLFPILVIMLVVSLSILCLPLIRMHTEDKWVNELSEISFRDVLSLMENFTDDVYEGAIITMTVVPLLASVITLLGAILNKRWICFTSSFISSAVLIYFLYCIIDSFSIRAVVGETAMLSWGFWIPIIGHIVTCIVCKSE